MAPYTAANAKSATLSGTTVDTVTLTAAPAVEVSNDAPDGSSKIWARCSFTGTPPDPTAGGDDCSPIPPGGVKRFERDALNSIDDTGSAVVKIIGNGNAYVVEGVQ